MNKLCKLKGHMWYTDKRKDVARKDRIYSMSIEKRCVRCGEIKNV